ncbi:transcriptional regulator, GntR family [Schinkia azotoformans MEV2011]|uniref:Transcriptional regulator, GntR family n=3 Tax=Schinkia azotoformans TaxID=1454 RepID=A0A072NJS4_SCHAZ|nr:transcriptional regulator, GntR family [Schinkia azotoformans MEV2011]
MLYGKAMENNQNTNQNLNPNPAMSKTQYAYEFLRSKILDGVYVPGQRIVIDQLAKELGTSTIPIREAIRNLESDGLIQYKPYSGAIVSVINETEYVEVLSVIAILEGYATSLSARHITVQNLEELQQLNKLMAEALNNFEFETISHYNRKFHAIIFEKCGNTFLIDQIGQAQQRLDRLRRSIFTIVPQRARQSIEEHDTILNLIKESAPLHEIEEVVRNHRINTLIAFQNRKAIK